MLICLVFPFLYLNYQILFECPFKIESQKLYFILTFTKMFDRLAIEWDSCPLFFSLIILMSSVFKVLI